MEMTIKLKSLRKAAVTFGAATAIAGATTALRTPDVYLAVDAAKTAPAIEVTRRDVDASNEKVRMAHAALAHMWTTNFQQVGERFAVPGLARYRSLIASPCGMMRPSNAGYCPRDNTIYFDDVFLAAQAKAASAQLGTDGDMAGIGIIAHEMGHAVAIQLGYQSRATYPNEAIADCLAGAFTDESRREGNLEPGDIEEAFFGMAAAGDPTPELTGNPRMDNRILRVASIMGHGTREQRTSNFRRGLDGGAGACLDEFAN
jgi:predicted metalloprotease